MLLFVAANSTDYLTPPARVDDNSIHRSSMASNVGTPAVTDHNLGMDQSWMRVTIEEKLSTLVLLPLIHVTAILCRDNRRSSRGK